MLPAALDDYLKAKRDRDGDALVATLVDDAVVRDEGNEYRGKAEIRAWHERVAVAVNATYQVGESATVGGRTVVEMRMAGDFPGSPVTLWYHVGFRDGLISSLTVVP